VITALRKAVLEVDPDLPVTGPDFFTQFHLMRELLGRRLADRNVQGALVRGFAAIALVLALVGLFGVLSYLVAQRTREIGVRIALAASRTNILKVVLGHAMCVLAIGILIGALGALVTTRMLRSSLYGVGAADPLTFAAAALVFIAAALVQSSARRSCDPGQPDCGASLRVVRQKRF
jgi:putative ABC transport system permease protein